MMSTTAKVLGSRILKIEIKLRELLAAIDSLEACVAKHESLDTLMDSLTKRSSENGRPPGSYQKS